MDKEDAFYQMVYQAADAVAHDAAPSGVATESTLRFTSDAFDYYVARHGVPTTANAARLMFEYAAGLHPITEWVLENRPTLAG